MLVVKELDDGLPGVAVVDIVTEARRVNDGQADWVNVSLSSWDSEGVKYP